MPAVAGSRPRPAKDAVSNAVAVLLCSSIVTVRPPKKD